MKLFKYIFTLIAIVTTINASAQVYPVQVTVATTPPYYNYLSHYGDQNNHLLVVATLTDFNSPPVNVRLRLKIEGSGYILRTRQDVPVGTVYTLSPGVPVFIQGDELLPLLSEQNLAVVSGSPNLNNLPEGITTICIEVVENGTGGSILSTSNCTSFLLQLMQPSQPFLPICNSVVDTTSMFQTFQWSQPQNYIPSIGSELNYTFSLYEWIDTNNYNIFQTGQGLVYSTQTTSPIVQVSNFDVAFQKGRKYVWRVRAQLSSNGLPTQMITQNGLSQPCSFYYGKPITVQEALADGLSINLSTQALTTRKGQAIWTVTDATPGQGLSTYSSYIVEYRKKTPEGSSTIYPWSIDTVSSLMLPIYQLEPEQTYEVRVAGMSGGYTSDRTPISQFTTPSARVYACGEADLPFVPGNYQPLPILHMGDVVQIGQFPLNVTQATPLGTPGRFSGYGEIPHDFLAGAKVKVCFDNLLIDKEYIVREGIANAMTDGAEGWMNDYYLDHAFRDTVGYVTAYGYSGDSTSIFVVVDGDTLSYTFNLPYPIVIYGEGNVAYQFFPDGTVVITTWGTTPSTDQLDATKNLFTRFETVEGSEQFFDKKQYDHLAANYEVIQCAENFNYWVPNTAKGTTGTTQVKATVHVNTPGYVPTNMSFEIKGGYTTISHTQLNDTTFLLTLPAKPFDYQVYARYEEFKIGKLNVMSYDSVSKKIRIVPLVSIGNLSASSITESLGQQFSASKLGFEVIVDSVFNTTDFTSSTTFTNPDANLMEKYTSQMRLLRSAYINQRGSVGDQYLIFVVPSFENPDLDGYMVRGKGLGFVSAGTLGSSAEFIHTLSHELGHGIAGLEHAWGSDLSKKGVTDNLMDYSSSSVRTLTRIQWDAMHDAPFTLSLFDDEEDGSGYTSKDAFLEYKNASNNSLTFLTPSGKVISLPVEGLEELIFVDDHIYAEHKPIQAFNIPIGTLGSFKINGKMYSSTAPEGYNLQYSGYEYRNSESGNEPYVDSYSKDIPASQRKVIAVLPTFDKPCYDNNPLYDALAIDFKAYCIPVTSGQISFPTTSITYDNILQNFDINGNVIINLINAANGNYSSKIIGEYHQDFSDLAIKFLALNLPQTFNNRINKVVQIANFITQDERGIFESYFKCTKIKMPCHPLKEPCFNVIKLPGSFSQYDQILNYENQLDNLITDLLTFSGQMDAISQQVANWQGSKEDLIALVGQYSCYIPTFTWNARRNYLTMVAGNTNDIPACVTGSTLSCAEGQIIEILKTTHPDDYGQLLYLFKSTEIFQHLYVGIENHLGGKQNFDEFLATISCISAYNFTSVVDVIADNSFFNYSRIEWSSQAAITQTQRYFRSYYNTNTNKVEVWISTEAPAFGGTTTISETEHAFYDPFDIIVIHGSTDYNYESQALRFNEGDNLIVPAIYLSGIEKSANDKQFFREFKIVTAIGVAIVCTPLITAEIAAGGTAAFFGTIELCAVYYTATVQATGFLESMTPGTWQYELASGLNEFFEYYLLFRAGVPVAKQVYNSALALGEYSVEQFSYLKTHFSGQYEGFVSKMEEMIDKVLRRSGESGATAAWSWIDDLDALLGSGTKAKVNSWINKGLSESKLEAAFENASNKQALFTNLDNAISVYHQRVYIKDWNNIPGISNTSYAPNGLAIGKTNPNWNNSALDLPTAEAPNFVDATPIELQPGTKLYRVTGGNKAGAYWTLEPPSSLGDVIGGTAVRPQWNNFENLYVYEVPQGQTLKVWQGQAAKQQIADNVLNPHLPGGDQQIFIPQILRNNNFATAVHETTLPW